MQTQHENGANGASLLRLTSLLDEDLAVATTLFEHTVKFDEQTYRAIWGATKSIRWLRFIIAVTVGLIMLFWSYTFLLGLLVLGLSVLQLVSSRLLTKGLRHNFHGHKYLRQPLIYGVSDERLWVRGESLDASAAWSLLVTWQIRSDWLILAVSGIPEVYLPVAGMRKSGSFERIMELASTNGTEFK